MTELNDRTEHADLTNEIAALDAELTRFRTAVRDHILDQHYNHGWCLPGTQQALKDLGLPPVTMSFTGSALLRVQISAVTDATELDEARNRIIQSLQVVCPAADIDFELDYIDPMLEEQEIVESPSIQPPTRAESPF